ncbi:MAG: ABC transporter ATP-binding protein [Cyanobacterium sp. T60_A2020_053]|nr:ABC transporter ATP-binding protein [Cyanobacterium sp. T60_A2020_053]
MTEVKQINNKKAVVETYDLTKTYVTGFWLNKKIPSLKNCTLQVFEGETFGLLGPNGAGKTTLLKTLLGIIKPTSGKAFLLGKSLGDNSVKKRLGYLPENAYYYEFLTGWEFLNFIGDLFQIPSQEKKRRIIELLDLVGLAKNTAQKKQLRQYSKGMMQRVGMAQALINNPEIVFFDEPMSGLDPMGRYQVRQIILSLKEQGKTIFFNSHILADVEKICDRIAILGRGELLNIGSLDDILGTTKNYQVVVKNISALRLQDWLDNIRQENDLCIGELKSNPEDFMAFLRVEGAGLISMNLARESLEDYFIQQLKEKGIVSSQ